MKPLPALEVHSARVLKTEPHFQLSRVVARDGRRLVIKCAASNYPGTFEDGQLEREFRFFSDLDSRRTLRPVGLMTFGARLATCFEDVDGYPLGQDVLDSSLRFPRLAAMVRDLCGILLELHRKGLVLVGLTPHSAVVSEHGRIILTDALIAQPVGLVSAIDAWLEPSYLPYLAPEVVARSPLLIDQRADLYALGVVLYELMCKALPFTGSDPGEIIQGHLARQPRAPSERDATIPSELSQLVMRLLAKDPAKRFTTVAEFEREFTLRTDPAARTSVWETSDGEREHLALSLPAELFGREAAIAELLAKIDQPRVRPELLVIEGEAGMGKTALAQGVERSARRQRAVTFAWGKFSQVQAASPLSGWTACLRALARDVLTTSSGADLEDWRRKLVPILGANAPWIAALVPEWAVILGCVPMVSGSMLDSGLERLALAVRSLLGAFAGDEAPVVLVLDDLQWADASSLKILDLLVSTSEPLNLVVLGLVREEPSVDQDDGLAVRWRALTSAGATMTVFQVNPLAALDVEEFVHATFREGLENLPEFVDKMLVKTGGSPFFVREFLHVLMRRGVLHRTKGEGPWRWDARALNALPLADNVITLLASKIVDLPAGVKDAVQIASILGPEFALEDLCCVLELPRTEALVYLERMIDEGLIVVLAMSEWHGDDSGRASARDVYATHSFVHDRVFEACLSLLEAEELAHLHLKAGRALKTTPRGLDGNFRIAAHLNAGRHLITQRSELLECATLNLQAGREAKRRGAFSQALELIEAGLDFLARTSSCEPAERVEQLDRAWHEQPELSLALHEEGGEAALLSGRLDLMHAWCDRIVEHAHSPFDKITAYDIRISGLKAAKRFSDAVSVALEILAELGVKFSTKPHIGHILFGFLRTKRLIPRRADDLLALPEMTDPRVRAVARIIQSVYPAAYLGRPKLFPLLVYRHVVDAIHHGNSAYSAVTYNAFAAVFCAMGKFDAADELGKVGLALVRGSTKSRYLARAYSVYYFLIYPWKHSLWSAVPYYQEGIRDGIAQGDFEFGSYLMTFESLARFHSGESLPQLHPVLERHRDQLRDLGQERSILMQSIVCQTSADLRDKALLGPVLSGDFYDEAALLPRCLEPLDENLVFHNYLAKVMLHVYFGDGEAGMEAARQGRRVLQGGAFGNYLGGIFEFYEAMAGLLGVRSKAGPRRAQKTLRRLRRWSVGAPSTFLHKAHLVAAELNRVQGRWQQAAEDYEKAIELALAQGAVHEAGLAQARAVSFYMKRDMGRTARHHLREARHSFQRWGATAVVRRLEADFAQEFVYLGTESDYPTAQRPSSSRQSLNYQTLLKSSQAISSETMQSGLLDRLLETIVEHAGAQRVVLLLEHDGKLHLESELDVNAPHRIATTSELADPAARLALSVVRYAARTREPVVLDDAGRSESFAADPYLASRRVRSLLCAPILNQGRLLGLIYLENNEVSHLFSAARLEMVNLLTTQAAISIANVRFHGLRLEAHQAKINPHFLFNALSSIASLTITDGPIAERAVIQLAELYRYILMSSKQQFVTLEQELHIVRSYLELEKLRYGTKLEFVVEHRGDSSAVRIPALVIQPLVENSIRHGIGRKVEGGRVTVLAQIDEQRCWILVEDDGDGPTQSSAGTGFGLKSIQERLTIAYGDRFSFSMTQRLGCRVEIEIPLAVEPAPGTRSSPLDVTGRF